MRMPLISGVNDDVDTICKISRLYRELGIHHVNLIAYHELGKVKASGVGRKYHDFAPPSGEHLQELKEIMEADGAEVEIIGEGV